MTRIGHLVKLSFPDAHKELKPDYSLSNPETRDHKDAVAGIIEYIQWLGGPNDSIRVTFQVSFQNKALLQEVFSSMEDNVDMEVAFVIYEYDYAAEKYFKRLHTFNKQLKCMAKPGDSIYLEEGLIYFGEGSRNTVSFRFGIDFMPQSGVVDQKLGFAFSSGGTQLSKRLEGKADGGAEPPYFQLLSQAPEFPASNN